MQTENEPEYDPTAPYGRKPNGEPYKTKPSMRRAMGKYQKKKYAENPKIQLEANKRWIQNNKDKVRKLALDHYYRKRAELEYYKELFAVSLETV
jgi:hypothetical protein